MTVSAANAGVINAAGDATPDAWQRFVAHMLRSYANPGAPLPPMPDAPAPIALYRAMVRASTDPAPPAAAKTADS